MKKLDVKVVAGSKADLVKKTEAGLTVYCKNPPIKGKANRAVVKLIADYLRVPRSRVLVISGEKNKLKKIGVLDD